MEIGGGDKNTLVGETIPQGSAVPGQSSRSSRFGVFGGAGCNPNGNLDRAGSGIRALNGDLNFMERPGQGSRKSAMNVQFFELQ